MLYNCNSTPNKELFTGSDKLLKVKRLLLSPKTQEKKDLFFSNKIANFACVEVLLN